ncbi:urea transporter [Sulfurimonas sp. SAG-AH-194-L11]|nr:urea transporter [Sulfurimonas sp. SAG-AH-194-L11]MDF1876333.1 urea transporter [Sulfurimonas sp. SAG-AH-194-L11]
MQKYALLVTSVLKPYSSLLFLNNKYVGLLLILITFTNPSVGLSGVFGVLFTILFAELIEFKESYLAQGFYIYNSLLVGMGIGFLFSPSLISIALIAMASAFTFMLSFMLNRLFSTYKIPILSLPFSIVTMFIYLASLKYSNLLSTLINNSTLYDIQLPLIISGFLKSFGTIFFLPTNIAGALILLLVLYFSRILFVMAVSGYYFGITIHSYLIGSYEQALYDPYAFNYILVAVALCGVFLLPTWKNYILALIGVAISVMLTDAIAILFSYYSIPVFTLPFNITVIVFIFILSITYYKEFNLEIKSTPEESLSNYLSRIFRFGKTYVKLSLPFSGEWSVYQAFDDTWTHKGEYKYAYDFVKIKEGKTYANEGLYATDYYAFGESILSPVSGHVIAARHDLVDNIIGEVDRVNNWGNYIIIKSDSGFFVEISHLMQYSLTLKVGDYVETNAIIAKCGNSGYSPEPHIHIQAQYLGVLGGFTQEFCFSEYVQEDRLLFNSVPKKSELINAVIKDRSISSRLHFILDDVFEYEVYENEKFQESVVFRVKMNTYSQFYLEDEAGNELYFYNDTKQFYFYNYKGGESHLKWLFKLAPRIPFVSMYKIHFVDYLPVYLVKSKLKSSLIEFLATLNQNVYRQERSYYFDGKCINSVYGEVCLAPTNKALTLISYNKTQLRRKL